jgi:hypothetical protein
MTNKSGIKNRKRIRHRRPDQLKGNTRQGNFQFREDVAVNAQRKINVNMLTTNLGQQNALQGVQRRVLAENIARVHGNRYLQTVIGAQHPPGTAPLVQRTPGPREKLQKKYGIVIKKGDKAWSAADIKDLKWALKKLTKEEGKVLRGYHFIRWSTPAARQKVDPTYKPPASQECGLHEVDLAKKSYKISMYDKCFDKSTTMAGVAVGRFHILHEIGHAMELAEQIQAWNKYKKLEDKYNKAIDAYKANPSRKKKAIVTALEKKLNAADKKYKASVGRTLREFSAKVKGKAALTKYSKTNMHEAFAEAFALYKIDPKGIKRANPKLAKWLASQKHLK